MSLLLLFGPAGSGSPPPPPVVVAYPIVTPTSKWRVVLTDRYGQTISNVSPIAFDKQLTQTLNRPSSFSFKVPSSDVRVRNLHTDGYPYLDVLRRGVRVYRYELQADGSHAWVIRFAGHVWQLEDEGDADTEWTTVTCFDPFQMLGRRLVRQMRWFSLATPAYFRAVNLGEDQVYDFDLTDSQTGAIVTQPITEIARGLLAATNEWDGFTGLADYYGSDVSLAPVVSTPTAATASPHYTYGQRVGDAIVALSSTYGAFDFEVVPVDTVLANSQPIGGASSDYASIPGYSFVQTAALFRAFGALKFYSPQRGSTLSNVLFAYAAPPHTLQGVSLRLDAEQAVNVAQLQGALQHVQQVNGASVISLGALQDAIAYSDISDSTLLGLLGQETVLLGGAAVPTYTLSPQAGISPMPFDNFNIGDAVQVVIGASLRGGEARLHRVQGWTLDIGDDHVSEVLSQVITTPVV